MRPEHCLFDVEKNMKYRIAKVKRNPSSDSYAMKLGNLKKNKVLLLKSCIQFFSFWKFILKGNSHLSSTDKMYNEKLSIFKKGWHIQLRQPTDKTKIINNIPYFQKNMMIIFFVFLYRINPEIVVITVKEQII